MSIRFFMLTLTVAIVAVTPVAAAEAPTIASAATPQRLVVFEGFYRPT